MEWMLKIGGIYNLVCALLHILFPKAMNWQDILSQLSEEKRPFVAQPLYIMNWCMAVLWAILAWLPFAYADQMMAAGLGRGLLVSIVIFWIIRIFILQPIYIGLKDPISKKMLGFFMIGLILFSVPLAVSIFQ